MPKKGGVPKNLISFDKRSENEARKNGAKGGKRSGEVRRANKTLRQIVKDWAEGTPTQDELAKLAEVGITGESATRKATLLIPLLSNVASGNMRALNMLVELLGEDERKKQELAKLRAETKLVEAETEKLRREIGDNTDDFVFADNIIFAEKYTSCMKIVFCGGGTAGHVTPNLALIDKLNNAVNFYIGTDGMEKKLTEKYLQSGKIAEYCDISATKFQRKLTLKNLLLPFCLLKSIRQSKAHLKRLQPDVVFSKGGYVGLPVVIAAKSLKIPTIIHESDMSLGLANKISAVYADKLLSTYPCHKKAKAVGAIIREEVLHGDKQKGLDTMQFDGSKPVLLVMGGSLGAKALNDAVCANPQLASKFDIFVICGKGKTLDCDFVHQTEFVSNIGDVFAASTVCLTRAGSNSTAELTLAQVPFVAVPLKKCSRGEQIKNAEWFAERGCGLNVDEDDLSGKLERCVNTVFDNRINIQKKQKQQAYLFGTDKVLKEILQYDADKQ